MESVKPKPMTAYERRKVTEQRKKAQGLTKKSYYLGRDHIELIKTVKEQLSDDNATNDEALAYILNYYKQNAL